MFFAEWMAPASMDRDDPAAPRLANPSHGVIHRQRDMERERRAAITPEMLALFDADYLGRGVWPTFDEDREPEFSAEVWSGLEDLAPQLVGDRVIAVHRSLDRRVWAIAAGSRTARGRVHVEVGYLRATTLPQVALYLATLIELWEPAAILVDSRSSANVLVPRMRDLGFEVLEASTPQMARACGGIVDAVEAGELSHVGQDCLEKARLVVQRRVLPQGDFVWNDAELSMPQWTAVTLAHWATLMFAQEVTESASPAVAEDATDLDEMDVMARAF